MNDDFATRVSNYVTLSGQLWVLVTLQPSEEAAVRAAGGGDFEMCCYPRICLLHATTRAGSTMRDQLKAFLTHYAAIVLRESDIVQKALDALSQHD